MYCVKCGNRLEIKYLENEGNIPFCNKCMEYRFETFNVAVSLIITTKDYKNVLLIQQYGKKRYILVAGYVNKGESAEDACYREVFEEVGLNIKKLIFQKTKYYEKSNTLMINYVGIVDDIGVKPNYEIDSFKWFGLDEAKDNIASPSLAEEFYLMFYERVKNNEI